MATHPLNIATSILSLEIILFKWHCSFAFPYYYLPRDSPHHYHIDDCLEMFLLLTRATTSLCVKQPSSMNFYTNLSDYEKLNACFEISSNTRNSIKITNIDSIPFYFLLKIHLYIVQCPLLGLSSWDTYRHYYLISQVLPTKNEELRYYSQSHRDIDTATLTIFKKFCC